MNSGRLTLFDSPLFLGFDQLEETFDRLRKSAGDGYPPYNIEQLSDTQLRISVAVAGFKMKELDVEIENSQLVVRGKQQDDKTRLYLHRGIASRQFQKSFVLAEGIEVRSASLDNGLLHVDLERIIPEKNTQKIKITETHEDADFSKTFDVENDI